MVVGLNHNIMYRGEVFHIQTEDSGLSNPSITTLLFRGGTIIASRKTGYADIVKVDNLEQVVEELMKEQHKDMLRRLKAGEFDQRAFPGLSTAASPPAQQNPVDPPPPVVPAPQPQTPKPGKTSPKEQNLDDIILAYLSGEEE